MLSDKLKNSNQRTKILAAAALLVFVGIAAYDWMVAPHIADLHASQLYGEMAQNSQQKLDDITKKNTEKEEQVALLTEAISEKESGFFTVEATRVFFADIEMLCHEFNCNVESLVFLTEEVTDASEIVVEEGDDEKEKVVIDDSMKVGSKKARIGFTGQYDGIVKFLEDLSSYRQYVSISDIQIETLDRATAELICYVTIGIYYMEDTEQVNDE